MKHFILALSCVALAAFTACSTEEKVAGSTPGTGINFVLSSPASTRTTWGADEGGEQLYWDIAKDEKVAVASMQTTSHTPAVYQVENSYDNVFSLVPNQADGLKWGTGEHTFYALYPANGTNSVINGTSLANGTATFLMNETQTCTVDDTIPDANGNYNLLSDPSQNAFMVADTTVAAPSEKVSLQFKPIMTTIRFVVKGPSGAGDVNKAIHLKGINVTYPAYQSFNYDIKTGKISGGGSPNSNYQVKVRIKNGDKDYLNLGPNETATFNVYLPPMSQDDPAQKNLKVDVVSWGDNGEDATIAEKKVDNFTKLFVKGTKTVCKLPALTPPNANPNAWMSQLDDRIYINQLSIPGTHDADASDANITSNGSLVDGSKFAVTQTYSLSDQWDKGVRCFDMRVCPWGNPDPDKTAIGYEQFVGTEPNLWTWHGFFRLKNSFLNQVNVLKDKLKKNPSEFAIFIMKYEPDLPKFLGVEYNNAQKNTDVNEFNSLMAAFLKIKDNADVIIPWRPNLTLGDCRGKIVLLTRWNDNLSGQSNWGWSQSAYITGWPEKGTLDNPGYVTGTLSTTDNSNAGKVLIQDFCKFKWNDGGSFPNNGIKMTAIQALLDDAANIKDGSSLVINYMSAYASNVATTDDYKQNAACVNQRTIGLIANLESATTGILMMDYAGDDTKAPTYLGNDYGIMAGQRLLTTILQNNTKPYSMLRKK